MKTFLIILTATVSIFVLIYVSNEFEIFSERTQGVRKQNVQTDVFKQTQAYIDGKNQELSKLYYDWIKSKKEDKLIIESIVRTEFTEFLPEQVANINVRTFLIDCRGKAPVE